MKVEIDKDSFNEQVLLDSLKERYLKKEEAMHTWDSDTFFVFLSLPLSIFLLLSANKFVKVMGAMFLLLFLVLSVFSVIEFCNNMSTHKTVKNISSLVDFYEFFRSQNENFIAEIRPALFIHRLFLAPEDFEILSISCSNASDGLMVITYTEATEETKRWEDTHGSCPKKVQKITLEREWFEAEKFTGIIEPSLAFSNGALHYCAPYGTDFDSGTDKGVCEERKRRKI